VRLGLHKIEGVHFVTIVEKLAAYVKNPPAIAALGREVFGWPGKVGTARHRKFLRSLKKKSQSQNETKASIKLRLKIAGTAKHLGDA
jgi:hypothetical protein